jgi:hypothetical protein
MGIEFIEIADRERLGLEEVLRRLDGNPDLPDKLPLLVSPATAFPLLIADPAAALNAVASFFQDNEALTREQFTELIQELTAKSCDGNQGASH